MLSVNHLAMLAKTACSLSGVLDWVDQSLADVEEHLKVYATFICCNHTQDYSIQCTINVCRAEAQKVCNVLRSLRHSFSCCTA